ncbi:hypothetical protein [Enterobacter roggenkampii]|uniref:hypothetical protein n=1 Tax=Enterobacter roggenkampii TaxID=1812935 RepID=UPI0019288ABA|nr:hypothetical protein [Enterobacter roggenkampii]
MIGRFFIRCVDYLKNDITRYISVFFILGFVFSYTAYKTGGEPALKIIVDSFVSTDPLFLTFLKAAYIAGLLVIIVTGFISKAGCRYYRKLINCIFSVAEEMVALYENIALLLAGFCLTGMLLGPQKSLPGIVFMQIMIFFTLFYAFNFCVRSEVKFIMHKRT